MTTTRRWRLKSCLLCTCLSKTLGILCVLRRPRRRVGERLGELRALLGELRACCLKRVLCFAGVECGSRVYRSRRRHGRRRHRGHWARRAGRRIGRRRTYLHGVPDSVTFARIGVRPDVSVQKRRRSNNCLLVESRPHAGPLSTRPTSTSNSPSTNRKQRRKERDPRTRRVPRGPRATIS